MRDEPGDDEPLDAVPLELQIQIRVGEATGAPVLRGDNLARLRRELGTDLAAPRAVFEGLVCPRRLLNGRNVLPRLVVARTVAMMQCVEDPKLRVPRGIQDLQHMGNAVVRFGDGANAPPYLAALGNEVVVRIDHQKCSGLPLVCGTRHDVSPPSNSRNDANAEIPRNTSPCRRINGHPTRPAYVPLESRQ